ncbi:MAG TPA: SMC family ATPase [Anaerovoracaceae bacterium]|nr:SMC family ATPase [Anaerovoracaceae bacterium]
MDPLRLVLENFMGHRYTDIDCTLFNSVLIVGKSKHDDQFSNGAGKSTIFKAVEFVLFGEYETKTIDKIVRRGCDRARVIFDFSLSGQTFRVQRTRNKKSGKSDLRMWEKKGDTWHDVTQKTSTELEHELAKMIKISYQAFKNSVLFARGDIEGLSSTKSPEKRRAILKEALNLADYSKFEKVAKEDASEVNKKILAQRAIVSSLGKPDEDITEYKSKLKIIKKDLLLKEKERESLREALVEKRVCLTEHQRVLSSDANSVQEKLVTVSASKRQIRQNISSSQNVIAEKERHLNQSSTQLEAKIAILQQLENELTALKIKTFRATDVVKKDLDSVANNEANGRSYVFTLETKIKELRQPLPDGDICPHCRQPMSPDHKKECAKNIASELVRLNTELVTNKKGLEQVRNKKAKLEIELKEISDTNSSIVLLESKIENKKLEIKQSKDFVKQVTDLVAHYMAELTKNQSTLNELMEQEVALQALAKNLNIEEINAKILQTSQDIDNLERKSQLLANSISSVNTQVGIMMEKLSSRQKDNDRLNILITELKEMEKDFQIRQMVVQSFSSGGIPTMIIYTILDDLQIEANRLLSELRPGFELQFSVIKNKSDGQQEDTLEIIYRLHGTEFEYEELSDGQRLMVSLCLRIGLSLVIQHRLGVDIKFLEIDEVDEKFDKAAVSSFAAMIKKLQDKFKIFVITHNDSLKNKFSHAILVEYDEHNGSTAQVVSSW